MSPANLVSNTSIKYYRISEITFYQSKYQAQLKIFAIPSGQAFTFCKIWKNYPSLNRRQNKKVSVVKLYN